MKTIKIWLDDEREEPEGWIRAFDHAVAIGALELAKTQDAEVEISLDHDLGDDDNGTGYDVLLWIEEQVANHGYIPPTIHIHTANASAREKMNRAVEAIKKLHEKNWEK